MFVDVITQPSGVCLTNPERFAGIQCLVQCAVPLYILCCCCGGRCRPPPPPHPPACAPYGSLGMCVVWNMCVVSICPMKHAVLRFAGGESNREKKKICMTLLRSTPNTCSVWGSFNGCDFHVSIPTMCTASYHVLTSVCRGVSNASSPVSHVWLRMFAVWLSACAQFACGRTRYCNDITLLVVLMKRDLDLSSGWTITLLLFIRL